MPLMATLKSSGTRSLTRAVFPFTRRTLNLWKSCLMATYPSAPLCLARTTTTFFTSLIAVSCHLHRLSRARGTNTILSCRHCSPAFLLFLVNASWAPWPGVVVARATMEAWRGYSDLTSQAVSLPLVQQGRNMLAGFTS